MTRTPSLAAVLALLAFALLPALARADDSPEHPPGSQLGPPRIDLLKDAQVTPDPDGGYFLTGTAATLDKTGKPDFDYNRGAPLFHSADLKTWKPLGYAWDRVEHFQRTRGRPKIGVWLDWSAPAGRIDALLAHATTSPRLYRVGKDWFILCAMNGQNIIVQKSASGKPDGPCRDYAYLVTRGGHPSLFTDSDGAHYLLYADAWLAPLAPDFTKLTAEPRPLLPKTAETPGEAPLTLGERGAALFKHDGRYCLFAARRLVRDGKPAHDAFLWTAPKLFGPYSPTAVVLHDTGPVTVFQDPDGAWHAVSSRPAPDGPRILLIPAKP
jgi:beta-xylosidase